jgi:hypothetical protein
LGETAYPLASRLAALGVPFLFATGEVTVRNDPGYGDRLRPAKPIRGPELRRSLEKLLGTWQSSS